MKQLKEKGITLVALIVTIIILLILAGVTISQIGGNNGLFSRVKQAVDKYKNASLEEQESILEFEKYMTDFTITGGDEEAKIKIIGVEAIAGTDKITVKVTIEGTATRVEYNKSKDEKWYTKEGKEDSTEYIFENVEPGSYLIKVRVYDEEGNYQEATSGIVTVMPETTAEAEDVLEGKTYITGESKLKTGKMPKNGKINETLSSGQIYTIPKGYHDGTGKIIAEGLSNQTQGNAGEGDILEGKIAWVNGEQVIGTMENKGKVTQTLNAGQSYTIPAGYHNGQGTVAAKSLEDQTPGTATEEHILSGDKAWVNGKQLTGTMTNYGMINNTIEPGGSLTLGPGYYEGVSITVPQEEREVKSYVITTKTTGGDNASMSVLPSFASSPVVVSYAGPFYNDENISLIYDGRSYKWVLRLLAPLYVDGTLRDADWSTNWAFQSNIKIVILAI